jgi:hypothetical protein
MACDMAQSMAPLPFTHVAKMWLDVPLVAALSIQYAQSHLQAEHKGQV